MIYHTYSMACCLPNPSVSSVSTEADANALTPANQEGDAEQVLDSNDDEGRKEDEEINTREQQTKPKDWLRRPQPGTTCTRLYHSAVNRKRAMERIDRENQALLKRLDTMKPSRGMSRAEQLAEYDRQAPYRGLSAPDPSPVEVPSPDHFKLMLKAHHSRAKLSGFLQ